MFPQCGVCQSVLCLCPARMALTDQGPDWSCLGWRLLGAQGTHTGRGVGMRKCCTVYKVNRRGFVAAFAKLPVLWALTYHSKIMAKCRAKIISSERNQNPNPNPAHKTVFRSKKRLPLVSLRDWCCVVALEIRAL